MAKRKKPAAESAARVGADEKIARLLALLLTKGMKNSDSVPMLRRAGFDVAEVADMLGMTENNVRVTDHQGRKRKAD